MRSMEAKLQTCVEASVTTRSVKEEDAKFEPICPSYPHLNDYGKLYQVPFVRRRAEMDVQIDFVRPNQLTELFKKPMIVEVSWNKRIPHLSMQNSIIWISANVWDDRVFECLVLCCQLVDKHFAM